MKIFLAYKKRNQSIKIPLILVLILITISISSQVKQYNFSLNGVVESPPNASLGTGTFTVIVDQTLNTLRIQGSFSNLTGTVTVAHIHAATAMANTGTAGVAINSPSLTNFPTGVTSGTYDNTFDMTLASSYNSTYITNNGGTTSSAFTAIVTALDESKAYLNIHSSSFGGGEIRSFSVPVLSTEDFNFNSNLLVYPNPSRSQLNIKIDRVANIEVFDLSGKYLLARKIESGINYLDLSNFNTGIYVLKTTDEFNQVKTIKLIKQ